MLPCILILLNNTFSINTNLEGADIFPFVGNVFKFFYLELQCI